MNKVIHIYSRSYSSYFPFPDTDQYYLAGWASLQAKELQQVWKETKQEVWRLESEVKQIKERTIQDVNCRLYPMTKRHQRYGIPTRQFISSLRKESKEHQVIFDIHFQHSIGSIVLLYILKKEPVVIHHHGDIPYRNKKKKGFVKGVIYRILAVIEEYLLRSVDACSVISSIEKDYLEKHAYQKRIYIEHGRRFFNQLKPIQKNNARLHLGLRPESKVLLYVGHYYKLKGVDVLLSVFRRLKAKDPLFELIMIGGVKNDENVLYDEVANSGAINIGRISNDKLRNYYCAADIYLLYSEDENLVNYGGIGTAVIEAMAYDTPVISTQLIHFPKEDVGEVGEIVNSVDDLEKKIYYVLNNYDKYNPRIVSQKYYDFRQILDKNKYMYARIFQEHFEGQDY